MIPTKENIAIINANKRSLKHKVHAKISNTFIENAIGKSTLSALKIIYYLATIFDEMENLENMAEDELIKIRLNKRDLLVFTELSAHTLVKAAKQMQETSITFIDDENQVIEGLNLLPKYKFLANKDYLEIAIFARIARMIIGVKRNYTPLNIKELMKLQNKHSLRFLALLCLIYQDSENKDKSRTFTLDEFNAFFGVEYKTWSEFERKILEPVKEELKTNSKLNFTYEPNFEVLGPGRPCFKDCTVNLKSKI